MLKLIKKILSPQFIKFVLVGMLNTAFGYAIFASLMWIGLHYTLATLIGTVAGVLFNFKTYGRLVFKDKSNRKILRYIFLYSILYILNNVFIFMMKRYGISPYISGIIWVIPNALISYFISKKYIFNQKINKSNDSMENLFIRQKNKVSFWTFLGIALILLVSIIFMAKDAGMSGDETFHRNHAENVYNWYKTMGSDTTAVTYTQQYNMPLYGQAVDNIAFVVHKWVGYDVDEMLIRHITNAIFGWLAMFFAALIAYAISKKWAAAIIVLLLMFFSPRFLGHSFNNLKDLPSASALIIGVYFIIRFFQTFPKVPIRIIVLLALSIGFATAIRVSGLILVAYLGLFAVIYLFVNHRAKNKEEGIKTGKKVIKTPSNTWAYFKRFLLYGIIVTVAGYLFAMILWPFLMLNPFKGLFTTFSEMSHFSSSIKQVWEGSMVWSDMLPWYYTPKFILMTIPLAVIVGFVLSLFFSWRKNQSFYYAIVLFACVFPIFWLGYSDANVYGGWRHAMFAYPPMVICAGLGFNGLFEWINSKIKNQKSKIPSYLLPFAYFIVPILLLIPSAIHIVKNHPYEYVYFNEFAGGIDKAFGNYELDYYYHSTREATEWIMKNADTTNLDGKKITIATWHQMSVDYFVHKDTNHFQSNFSRWYQRSENDWDYAVFTVTGIDPTQLKSGFFPPQNTVYQVKVDDIPICIVLKRENRDGFIATQYRDKNIIDSAIYFYEKAIEYDPNDEVMLCDLGSIYFQTRQIDKAVELFERGLKIAPNDAQMTYYMANYYAMIGDANQAINTCKEMIKANPKNGSPYNLLVNIYMQQRKSIDAQKVLESMMDYGVFDNTAAQTYINIFTAAGLSEAAAYKKMYSALAKSFEKNGQKDLAKQYSDYAKQIR